MATRIIAALLVWLTALPALAQGINPTNLPPLPYSPTNGNEDLIVGVPSGSVYKVPINQLGVAGAGTFVTGPSSSISGDVATFNGATGKIIQDSGVAVGTSGAALGLLNANLLFSGADTYSAKLTLSAGLSVTAGGETVVGGIVSGSPTGGNQGNGTLNATGVFVNGAALGFGSVTSVAVSQSTGISASVTNPTTTPTVVVGLAPITAYSILNNQTGASAAPTPSQSIYLGPPGFGLSGNANYVLGQLTGSVATGPSEFDIQNTSNGLSASTDFIVNEDTATNTANFCDFGINSSAYNVTAFSAQLSGDGYVYCSNGNLVLGTGTSGKHLKINDGGTTTANIVASSTSTGLSMGTETVSSTAAINGLATLGGGLSVTANGATVTGGIVSGSPTGGNEGNGTLNATGVFVNGSAVPAASANINFTGIDQFSNSAGLSVSGPISSGANTNLTGTANAIGTVTSGILSGTTLQSFLTPPSTQSGTTYTLATADCGTTVVFTSSSGVTVTIPSTLSNCNFAIAQRGVGSVSLSPSVGASMGSRTCTAGPFGQGSIVSLIETSAANWLLGGDCK